MSMRIYVPIDSAALALGADDVAAAIQTEAARRGIAIDLVRNGTRGLLYLEPLVEVETPQGRIGFGNVDESDVAGLFDANFGRQPPPVHRPGRGDPLPGAPAPPHLHRAAASPIPARWRTIKPTAATWACAAP